MNSTARVGVFTVAGLALLFGIFLYWSNFAAAAGGYQIGVLFDTVAGLKTGSTVYMAGVPIGAVSRIDLQPDFKADVIIGVKKAYDIPRDAKFVVSAPLTGEATLNIEPPRRHRGSEGYQLPPGIKLPPGFKLPPGVSTPGPVQAAVAETPMPLWPREILPMADQPRGTTPASLSDLTEQGEATLQKLDIILLQLQSQGPQLAANANETVVNAKKLTSDADRLVGRLDRQLGVLSTTMSVAGANVVALTGDLRQTAASSRGRVDTLLVSLNASARSLNDSLAQLNSIAKDPKVKQNLLNVAKNLDDATRTLAELTTDLQQVAGDPVTQAQLKSTVANFNAAAERANSLMGSLGGQSNVYGVDPGAPLPASPAPGGSAGPKSSGASGHSISSHSSSASTLPAMLPGARGPGIGGLLSNLASFDVRLSRLSPQNPQHPSGNQIFTGSEGPLSDINMTLLPYSKTSFVIGANAIGSSQWTMNVAALERLNKNVQVGGGVLYSNLGAMTQLDFRPFSFAGLLYDPAWPTLDLYGALTPIHHLQLYTGERDVLHASRRFTYGLQLTTKP